MNRIIRIGLLSSGIGCMLLLTAFSLSFLNLYTLLPWLISTISTFILSLIFILFTSSSGISIHLIRLFSTLSTLVLILGAFKFVPLASVWNTSAAILLAGLLNGFILSNKHHFLYNNRKYLFLFGINIVPLGILLKINHTTFYTLSGIGLFLFTVWVIIDTFQSKKSNSNII
jgi:hypothetical protein